jgi:cell wall-associated NlpC family hydrolase
LSTVGLRAANGLPIVVGTTLAVAYLLAPPMGADLSAQVAWAEVAEREWPALLDLRWYGANVFPVWNVADMLPGDLVFYAYNTADPATIHHVGIYIGAGNMIDAPYTGANVRITPFLRGDFIGAVRPTAAATPAGTGPATPTTTATAAAG